MNIRSLVIGILFLPATFTAWGQQPPTDSPLLDHLVGQWTMEGTIAGQKTVHDVSAEWVLGHHYLALHEVSREKQKDRSPKYEATIYIGWNPQPKEYACVWLDVYGGLAIESIGTASAKENNIPFVFKDDKGTVTFLNDFVYDPHTDSWEWRMDNVTAAGAKPFGRVKLTRTSTKAGD